jgi:hypothetical protein
MARPSSFTQEKADLICEKIASGQSLRSICEQEDFPAKVTVLRWLRENEAFRAQYTRAREDQAETIFDEMLEIADDGEFDYETKTRDDGSEYEAVNHDHIQRAKLRIEARKWVLGKLAPKKYGDRIDLNHGGQKGNPILSLIEEVSGHTLTPKDDD